MGLVPTVAVPLWFGVTIEYDLTFGVVLGIALSYMVYCFQYQDTRQAQKVEVFWRYRKEVLDNQDLRNTIRNIETTKGNEIQPLLDLYEEIGLHASRDLIDLHLTDEILGDDIVAVYRSEHVNEWIDSLRKRESDDTYYTHFIALGNQLSINAEKRKGNK